MYVVGGNACTCSVCVRCSQGMYTYITVQAGILEYTIATSEELHRTGPNCLIDS